MLLVLWFLVWMFAGFPISQGWIISLVIVVILQTL